MSAVSRRAILAAASALPFSALFARRARADVGPLIPDPDRVLELPSGFSYRILERRDADMDDGYRVPGAPDGMACFDPGDGTLVLMRNHELGFGGSGGPYKPGQTPPRQAVNARALGGVTRVVLDKETRRRISSNLVLTGTIRNCAGGLSPWGWLSCEETFDDGHGYVYLCRTDAKSVDEPNRIAAYGKFCHEAATVDPRTMIAYLTEDRQSSSFYRFVPSSPKEPFSGKLQALSIAGSPRFDTARGMGVGAKVDIAWVDCPDPEPKEDSVASDAQRAGAAIIRRGEGLWFHDGSVYFSATGGGPAGSGQIFRVVPEGDGGTIELVAESPGRHALKYPDNITVSPSGGLVIAEDGGGTNYLRGLDARGEAFDFARCAYSRSELAGICFAPDGKTLFVNLQQDGLTLAIEGPLDEVFGAPPAPERRPPTQAAEPALDGCAGALGTGTKIAIPAAAAVAGIAWAYRRGARGS